MTNLRPDGSLRRGFSFMRAYPQTQDILSVCAFCLLTAYPFAHNIRPIEEDVVMKIITDKRDLTERAQTLAEFLQDIEDAGIDLATVNIEDESGKRFGVAKLVEEKTDGTIEVDLVLCVAALAIGAVVSNMRSEAEVIANARLIAAAPDMLAALAGEPDTPPSINPMGWLHEAVEELKRRGPAESDEDPDAFWTMVRECEAMENAGRAAIAKAVSP